MGPCRAAPQRLRRPDKGLIKRSTASGRHRTRLEVNATLLAASTLAQMASMAALSSRRRAFFSFALLDFLWEIRGADNRIKTHTVTSFPPLLAVIRVSIRTNLGGFYEPTARLLRITCRPSRSYSLAKIRIVIGNMCSSLL